ncbi:MAG: 50S ribosomal protein L24 [Fibrobacterota bacterium]|nr:50S ribosomal protein L24 [Fibrobacterota bacterium]
MAIKLRKQDLVKVITGKSKGTTGRIIQVFEAENRVLVEGVNKAKKHQKPGRGSEKGGIIDKEMPVHVSNVVLVNKGNEPVKVRKIVENGKRIRVEKKSGKAVD